MQIEYFDDTDTLLIIFNDNPVIDTIDINEDVLAEFDQDGHIVSMTVEHVKAHNIDLNSLNYKIAA